MKDSNSKTADDFYQLGNQYRREGNFQKANEAYMEAISLDSDSPAKEAKQMLDDIMNFYHKDAYNP